MKILIKYIFVLTVLFTSLQGFSYTVELSQVELQEKMEKKFPFKKKKFLLTTLVSNPIVKLQNELNHILISFDIKIMATKTISFNTSAVVQGMLEYKQEEKSFYFKELEVTELNLKNIPKKFHKGLKKTIIFVATSYLNKFPVFKIKDKGLKLKLVGALLQDIKIQNHILYIKLGY
jgi:Protein of unknown function (DUF1439)